MLNTMNFYPWNDIFWLILMLILLWITCWNVESVAICTKTFVQHFVENLLKMLKVLKKQIKAVRRTKPKSHVMFFARRTAPTTWPQIKSFKNYWQISKVWYNIIKERKVAKMKKPKLSEGTIARLEINGYTATSKYYYELKDYIDKEGNRYTLLERTNTKTGDIKVFPWEN